MERILTTREATVQTVQVEIKALKVGKKQVTMGLFRQLPYGELIDPETVQLRGVPWGHVNYWWDGDGTIPWHQRMREGRKLHVVWQLGDELRRAIVYQGADPDELEGFRTQIQEGLNFWFLARLPSAKRFTYKDGVQHHLEGRRELTLDGREFRVNLDMSTWLAVDGYWHVRDIDPQQEAEKSGSWQNPEQLVNRIASLKQQQEEAIARYRKILQDQNILDVMPEILAQQIREIQQARQTYEDAWAKQWQVLNALPQLFIAV